MTSNVLLETFSRPGAHVICCTFLPNIVRSVRRIMLFEEVEILIANPLFYLT
jgi:hypothetical protein